MAEHFVSIFGTEKDKVNCPFYYKIGACRHGDRCARIHNKPLFSQTLLIPNMYRTPADIAAAATAQGLPAPCIPSDDLRHHFDDFYLDVFEEMLKYGAVDELHVCANLADHLAGNTYVKFRDEDAAQTALGALSGRWYDGRPVIPEFSPVTDFEEGKCRPFEADGRCEHGGQCHFMHLRRRGEEASGVDGAMEKGREEEREREREKEKERERGRKRERENGDGYGRYGEGRRYSRDYAHYRDQGGGRERRYGRYEAGRGKDGERDYYRGNRSLYERDRVRDYGGGGGKPRERDRDWYGGHGRPHRSTRERRGA